MTSRRPAHHSARPRLPEPSSILLAVLTLALVLASAFVLGGLAAHPFAG